MEDMRDIFDVLRKKSPDEISSTTGRSPEQISYVVELLRKTKNIDPDRIGPRGCLVMEGWIAPTCGSARAGQLEVFCFKSEAEKVRDLLRELHRLEPGLNIGADLWGVAAKSRTQATIGDKFAEMTLPHRGSSILGHTVDELRGLSENDRGALRDDTYVFIRALNKVLPDNRRWYRQTSNQIVGWVPEVCFP